MKREACVAFYEIPFRIIADRFVWISNIKVENIITLIRPCTLSVESVNAASVGLSTTLENQTTKNKYGKKIDKRKAIKFA